ncbi:MAG: methylmalonyl-CoA mutase family protein [Candidatus Muirbacterium halophilum]|nr:methylmalonyl-CoA mutase family protein [Candidatus Muirbacterium halophilum]MCK9474548.1 methylmalonyl-CoA mutase family protein [Candidatus Muirbacterium halophilum]
MGNYREEIVKKFNDAKKSWEETSVNKTLSRFPERKKEFKTNFGLNIDRVYGPDENSDYNKLGLPGKYPFTRGVQPTMFRGRFWTMRQYAGFATAEETNERYKYLLANGTSGLSVAFDLPTQIGYDSDDAMSEGEVGKVGVAIDSLADMEILFDGIPLDKVSTSMTINAPSMVLLAMYIAVGEKQGVAPEKLNGTIQNDILKEYIARGTYIFPPKPSMRLITNIFEYCKEKIPNWNTISISGYHIREAGSDAAQEVAFTLADGIAYVQAAVDAGMDVDSFASRLSFFFNAHNGFFEEIAKFRAARRMWAKIMKERFNAKKEKSMMLRFHAQTGGSTLTAQQPDNNIVRVAIQALSAVLGGTQSLHTNSKDEALALPTEESVRIALRTQQIIAEETGVTDSIDPLGGSYYIEKLTDDIEKKAFDYINRIDEMGGAPQAIENGYIQNEIQKSAYDYQKSVETNDTVVVGVNKHKVEEQAPKNLLRVDMSVQVRQIAKLNKIKESRDNNKVQECLKKLESSAKDPNINLFPIVIESVKAYCTLGEICNTLRGIFGEYNQKIF